MTPRHSRLQWTFSSTHKQCQIVCTRNTNHVFRALLDCWHSLTSCLTCFEMSVYMSCTKCSKLSSVIRQSSSRKPKAGNYAVLVNYPLPSVCRLDTKLFTFGTWSCFSVYGSRPIFANSKGPGVRLCHTVSPRPDQACTTSYIAGRSVLSYGN